MYALMAPARPSAVNRGRKYASVCPIFHSYRGSVSQRPVAATYLARLICFLLFKNRQAASSDHDLFFVYCGTSKDLSKSIVQSNDITENFEQLRHL